MEENKLKSIALTHGVYSSNIKLPLLGNIFILQCKTCILNFNGNIEYTEWKTKEYIFNISLNYNIIQFNDQQKYSAIVIRDIYDY